MATKKNTTVIHIEKPTPPAIVKEMSRVVHQAAHFEVRDTDTHATALERIKALRKGERTITEYFEPARRATDAAKKEILAARDGLIGPFAQARRMYDQTAQKFEVAERERAEEEQRKLQEKARKEEEDRKLREAAEADAAGDKGLADAILEEPVTVPRVQVQPAVAKVKGVSTRVTWAAEVTDLMALIKYVAERPEWISLLEPAMPNLNRLAVAQHEALNIPGVRAVPTHSRATRS